MTQLPTTPKHHNLRGHLAALYADVISQRRPPDQTIGQYLRVQHIGGGARGFLAATVFALMRRRVRTLLLAQWAGRGREAFAWPVPQDPTGVLAPRHEAGLALVRWLAEDMGERTDAVSLAEHAFAATQVEDAPDSEVLEEFLRAITDDPDMRHAPPLLREAARWSIAPDLVKRWGGRFGAHAEKLFAALQQPAPLDVRVNTLLASREEALSALQSAGIDAAPTPYSPDGIRLARKAGLNMIPGLAPGALVVQDEGSQLVARALAPQPGWKVLDACAGGGGKSLHLAALMQNRGEVFAHDADAERLAKLRERLPGSGITCLRLIEPGTAAQHGPYDAVLVDAPCLGFGTLRRAPYLQWTGPLAERLESIRLLQREIIAQYAPLVKPGGRFVYAVCSFEPEETSGHAEALRGAGIEPEALRREAFSERPEAAPGPEHGGHEVLLLPWPHGTDGFYFSHGRRSD